MDGLQLTPGKITYNISLSIAWEISECTHGLKISYTSNCDSFTWSFTFLFLVDTWSPSISDSFVCHKFIVQSQEPEQTWKQNTVDRTMSLKQQFRANYFT